MPILGSECGKMGKEREGGKNWDEMRVSKVKFKENVSISIESKNLIWPLRKKGKIDIVLHEIFTITSP